MKFPFLFALLTLCSCSSQPNSESTNQTDDTLAQWSAVTQLGNGDSIGKEENEELTESDDVRVIRRNYASGIISLEVYENKLTKLDSWNEYYENGQLKNEGWMTNTHHIPVGIWKYYSSNGGVDSIVDHNKKYPISYFSALKIAATKGFKMPDIDVSLTNDSLGTFWQVARWTENKTHSEQTAEVILIDTRSGKVTQPKYQLIGIY